VDSSDSVDLVQKIKELITTGQRREVTHLYDELVRKEPTDVQTWFSLGVFGAQHGYMDIAESFFRQAHSICPDHPAILNNLGNSLTYQDKYTEAEEYYRELIRAHPDNVKAYNNLGNNLLVCGRLFAALRCYCKALKVGPRYALARNNMLMSLNYLPHVKTETMYAQHLKWGQVEECESGSIRFHNDRDPARKLRIGYVSGDFREHSVAYFIDALLQHHDRSQVEVTCFANVEKEDSMTARLRGRTDLWESIVRLENYEAAERIRAQGIDILVDLSGHTEGNRLGIFACRAAPVQVSYLGYPNTTGLGEMDYRLTDGWADPESLNPDRYYTEQLIRLESGFLSYTPPEVSPETGNLPARRNGHVTFGSFNNLAKVNERVISAWSQILKRVPNSRLVLKNKALVDGCVRERYYRLFESHGINREQVELIGYIPVLKGHLDLYNRIDIGLDTFPYNGTTTTCEALWMGVPVLALAGRCHAGRVGVSILNQAGLEDWIAADEDEYIRKCVAFAGDIHRIEQLRSGLRARLQSSALCDGRRLTYEVERAYRKMWRRWCNRASA